jgi:hypothetical protein
MRQLNNGLKFKSTNIFLIGVIISFIFIIFRGLTPEYLGDYWLVGCLIIL